MPEGQKNASAVAQILTQIEEEYTAAQRGLTGFAESAKHHLILVRMENMGKLYENLRALVGDEATRLMTECLEAIPEEERGVDGTVPMIRCSSPDRSLEKRKTRPILPARRGV